jgi:hypothetical protein
MLICSLELSFTKERYRIHSALLVYGVDQEGIYGIEPRKNMYEKRGEVLWRIILTK